MKRKTTRLTIMGLMVWMLLVLVTFGQIKTPVFEGYFKNVEYSNLDVYLQTGTQTSETSKIKKMASRVNDKKDMTTLQEIFREVQAVGGFKGGNPEKFSKTVDQIIDDGLTGCTDYGLVFAALTRAKGIPTVFVQAARIDWIEDLVKNRNQQNMIRGHILVEVYLQGEWYLVDSTAGKVYLDYDRNNFSLDDGYYVFAKSIEVLDAQIKNEAHNAQVMKEVFRTFDLQKYEAPLYDYIDLNTLQKQSSQKPNFSVEAPSTGGINSSPIATPHQGDFAMIGSYEVVEAIRQKGYEGKGYSLEMAIKSGVFERAKLIIGAIDLQKDHYKNPELGDLLPCFEKIVPEFKRKPGTVQTIKKGDQEILLFVGKNEEQIHQMLRGYKDFSTLVKMPAGSQSTPQKTENKTPATVLDPNVVVNEVGKPLKALPIDGERKIIYVPALPEKGFNFPYYLVLPSKQYKQSNVGYKRYLMMDTINCGTSNDLIYALEKGYRELNNKSQWSMHIAEELYIPLIYPVFPRPDISYTTKEEGRNVLYTHALDRDTARMHLKLEESGVGAQLKQGFEKAGLKANDFKYIDRQVIAMTDHAIEYLNQYNQGIEKDKIFLKGFSASGTFADRLATLHPHRVKAVASGAALDDMVIPLAREGGENLIFPIGVADYKEITGRAFDLAAHNQVARVIFNGASDTNDTVPYSDCYGDLERRIIKKVIGTTIPERNKKGVELYKKAGGKGMFVIDKGQEHGMSWQMNQYIKEFFKMNRNTTKPVYPKLNEGLEGTLLF